jgi:hypothetical protein
MAKEKETRPKDDPGKQEKSAKHRRKEEKWVPPPKPKLPYQIGPQKFDI